MRKQITSLLLTLAMLLSLIPTLGVTASAAEDTSYAQAEIRDYATFTSYLRSYDSRDLKLMEDIDYTVGIDDLSIDVMCNQKLDLNGHKIRIDASKRAGFENLLCIRRGEFTLYDSKGGGELAVSFPDDDKAYSIIMMSSEKKDEPSKFTMNGGTLTKLRPNMTYTYGASGCIGDDYFNKPENGKRSQITINGGTHTHTTGTGASRSSASRLRQCRWRCSCSIPISRSTAVPSTALSGQIIFGEERRIQSRALSSTAASSTPRSW